MSAKMKTAEAEAVVETGPVQEERRPVYVARGGRGRNGGTSVLLLFGQRAMAQGRKVKFLDGDLKSSTLSTFYPKACSVPPSLDGADFLNWVLEDLDDMAEDRISRELDVSGGSSSVEEVLRDLDLPAFCESKGFGFSWLCSLGPDAEDFRHVRTAVDAGHMEPRHMLLVLNEGVIRQGQNPGVAFEPVVAHADFRAMVDGGATPLYLRRLPVMDKLRKDKVDFYRLAQGLPGEGGARPRATASFMLQRWTDEFEAEVTKLGAALRLP